jgi:signal transduction histidine kinase
MVHCRSTLSAFFPRGKKCFTKWREKSGLMPSVNASSASVVQECLTNIHRHSGSKTALIRIEREENTVRIMVEDQGNGMSPERLAEIQSCDTGVGIRGMRERVRHFHGDLVIESDGSGTRVHAILPLTTPNSTYQSETQREVACDLP